MTIQTIHRFSVFLVKRHKHFHVCLKEYEIDAPVVQAAPRGVLIKLKPSQSTNNSNKCQDSDNEILFGVFPRNKKEKQLSYRNMVFTHRMLISGLRWEPKKYLRANKEPLDSQKLQAHFIKLLKEYYGMTKK